MKVLVTGATGSIGRHLVRRLCEAGLSVRALARPASDVRSLIADDVEIVRGDIRDAAAVDSAVRGCTQVYHLATVTARHRAGWHEYKGVNIRGAENLARAVMRAGVERLIHTSTASIYMTDDQSMTNENTPPRPNSRYRKTKFIGEAFLLSCHREQGLPVVVARLSSVYGPGLLNWLGLFRAIGTGHFRLIGSGENQRHLGYISDIVDGLLYCAEKPDITGRAYILTGPESVTIKQLVTTIAEEISVRQPIRSKFDWPYRIHRRLNDIVFKCLGFELPYAERYNLFFEDRIFDISKASNELGYRPVVSLREGIRHTAAWYRANDYLS